MLMCSNTDTGSDELAHVSQDPGLSPDTIFFNLFFKNLAADLKNDHALLASLSNATFVVAPNTGMYTN